LTWGSRSLGSITLRDWLVLAFDTVLYEYLYVYVPCAVCTRKFQNIPYIDFPRYKLTEVGLIGQMALHLVNLR
jgi:hypothetical protein